MNTDILNQKGIVYILVSIFMVTFGTQSIVYAQEGTPTITASVEAPLTESNLQGSIVTITLSGGSFERWTSSIRSALTISGVDGVTVSRSSDVVRADDTKVTVKLTFSGNIDADTPLVFTVGAGAIADYDGAALTAQLPVSAVAETLVATTEKSLTEATLNGSVVTLTLSGRSFNSEYYVYNALTVSGIEGASFYKFDVERISNTKVTVPLTFSGNIDADATLTLTLGADAIVGYNDAFTVQVPVTAVAESLVATTEAPLTEETLSGSVVTLTLSGRSYDSSRYDIERAITISGMEGVTISRTNRLSNTKVSLVLSYSGNIDTEATLTIQIGPNAIIGYNQALTAQLPVTAVEESLVATTEENPNLNVVKLTLSGRQLAQRWAIKDTLTISSNEGDVVEILQAVLVSDTEMTVNLGFNGEFNNDVILSITLGQDAILGYIGPALTTEVSVTPIPVSLTASTESISLEATLREEEVTLTESPLTETFLFAIRLTLRGRQFTNQRTIEDALTFSSPDGRIVVVSEGDTPEVEIDGEMIEVDEIDDLENLNDIGFVRIDEVDRVIDSKVLIYMEYFGDLSADAILTLTLGSDAILGYNEDFTFEFPVTAVEESLTATTEFTLTEGNIDGSILRLSTGRQFWLNLDDFEEDALTISGIEGVTIEDISFPWTGWLLNIGDATITLGFEGDFDTDATLTITVREGVIVGYPKGLTVEVPVTAVQQSDATVSISPSPKALPAIGEKLTLNLNIDNGENVAGYQATVWFDHSVLRHVKSDNGNYFPADAFFMTPFLDDYIWLDDTSVEDTSSLTIVGNTLAGARNGAGTLATLTFEVVDYKPVTLTLSEVFLVDADGKQWEVTTKNGEIIEPPELANRIFGDLNLDGVVDIHDLGIIKARFGQTGQDIADVNGDLLVDIVDLILVAAAFERGAASPAFHSQTLEILTAAEVQQWLSQAQHLDRTDPKVQRGILFLEQLLRVLTPKETALLVNFPNPFNPETWIPYHLAKDADVTLTIYAIDGQVVRRLGLGHQPAGMYQSRSRAAYWDGKNILGEPVTSGVYFYTLTADNFIATRKMLIRK